MLSIKGLIRFIDRAFLLKLLYLALLYSLVPVGEMSLLLYLKPYLGSYMLLSAVLFCSLVGVGIAWRLIVTSLRVVEDEVADGGYPAEGFACLAGSLIAGLLLITPGFVTSAAGLLLSLAFVRRGIGRSVVTKHENRLRELYEYMKL